MPPPAVATADTGARALAEALRALRGERAPGHALAILDEQRGAIERERLADEAELVRLEALLALGRRSAALALLDAAELSARVRGDELRLLRAELRAHAGRCASARADLAALGGADAALADRIARVRAHCENE